MKVYVLYLKRNEKRYGTGGRSFQRNEIRRQIWLKKKRQGADGRRFQEMR